MPAAVVQPRLAPEPVSRLFGFDRGTPIDRYYIEGFLCAHASDVRGRVLEVGDAAYIRRFGGDRVTRSDVLHATPGNGKATIVGDLETGRDVPDAAFDCIILTQVLPFVFDVGGAVATCNRALVPGGVVLATVPGISQISRYDMDRWGDYWRFTTLSVRRLFEQSFPPAGITVAARGNVRAATAFLEGRAMEEVPREELDPDDPDYQVIITVRAQKGSSV